MLPNILEGARLQARRMSLDLNNGGAESPAPSKQFSLGGEFSAGCLVGTSRPRYLVKKI